MDFCHWAWDICVVSLCQAVGPRGFFFFGEPLPPLSWSLDQLRINYPSRNKRPLTLEKLTIPSSPPRKRKSIGPLSFLVHFLQPTQREKSLCLPAEMRLSLLLISNISTDPTRAFSVLIVSARRVRAFLCRPLVLPQGSFLSCNLIVLTKAPIQCHKQPQNGTKIMHYEKCTASQPSKNGLVLKGV